MKYRDVRPGDCFMLESNHGDLNDVWLVLDVEGSERDPACITITYSFLHQLGEENALSRFDVEPEHPVDGVPLFVRAS